MTFAVHIRKSACVVEQITFFQPSFSQAWNNCINHHRQLFPFLTIYKSLVAPLANINVLYWVWFFTIKKKKNNMLEHTMKILSFLAILSIMWLLIWFRMNQIFNLEQLATFKLTIHKIESKWIKFFIWKNK